MGQPVVHLLSFPLNGHVTDPSSDHAADCWCEPASIRWVRNDAGVMILVVEHNDYTMKSRSLQLQEQEAGIPEPLAWVNHALYDPATYPAAPQRDIRARFPLLPPHEGEEGAP
jgi:hypothetical protein